MKYFSFFILAVIILSTCKKDIIDSSAGFPIYFSNDGQVSSFDNSSIITIDNNLLICGNQNKKGICVLKITQSGDLIWKTEFEKGYECYASSIYENENEEIFICGSMGMTNTTLGLSDVFIVKISKLGDTLWTKTYGSPELERGYQIIDGGQETLLISGTYEKYGTNSNSLYLLCINYQGDTIWTRIYDNTIGVIPYHFLRTMSGDFLLTGTYYNEEGALELILMKFDYKGDVLWDKRIGPAGKWGYCSIEYSNGIFFTCGRQNTFGTTQVMLIKTDNSGNTLWEKEYGDEDLSEEGYSMKKNNDGTIIIVGSTYNAKSPDDNLMFLKTDEEGNQIWMKTYGNPTIDEWGTNLLKDSNDDNILIGTTFDYHEDPDTRETLVFSRKIYMSKFDNNGNFK